MSAPWIISNSNVSSPNIKAVSCWKNSHVSRLLLNVFSLCALHGRRPAVSTRYCNQSNMIILLSIRWKLIRVVVEDVHESKVTVRIDIGYLGVPSHGARLKRWVGAMLLAGQWDAILPGRLPPALSKSP
jgi:hypothetical protein